MKINYEESNLLMDKFFNNPKINDLSLTLEERGLQKYWYNKNKFPFEPYFDLQPIGFDNDPKTYQDVLVLQNRMLKKFPL